MLLVLPFMERSFPTFQYIFSFFHLVYKLLKSLFVTFRRAVNYIFFSRKYFLESLICNVFSSYSDFFLVCELYRSGLQICLLFQTILDLWVVVILEVFSSEILRRASFNSQLLFWLVCFFCLEIKQIRFVYHNILDVEIILSEGFQY